MAGSLTEPERNLAALRRAVEASPGDPAAWRAYAEMLMRAGDAAGAHAAWARSIKASSSDPRLRAAAAALGADQLAEAKRLLEDQLAAHPNDLVALRMLADACSRAGRHGESERLLTRALELAPGFTAARYNLAIVLHRQNKTPQALEHADIILAQEPRNPAFRNLKAVALARTGENARALEAFQALLADDDRQPEAWMNYGNALRAAGRKEECIAAYRKCLALAPAHGEAYWRLANLKTVRLEETDIALMRAGLSRGDISHEDRLNLHFALGKALEDAAQYAESFHQYEKGNVLRRGQIAYSADANAAEARRAKALFTPDFFSARSGFGAAAPDPIFIVGLPRAGSTLIEQILASHSAVEGTWELPNIPAIVESLTRRREGVSALYPDVLDQLSAEQAHALGERYLAETRPHRKTGRPFFIDKLPNNFAHAGLIQLILPNAKIIDARRHPLGNCFAAFKQHFASGQHFSYNLDELGRYYRDYVELMAHIDAVLPGRVHRVIYERLVADLEGEVRRLLAYCGLDFEEACLSFHKTERAVHTASSEQVRQPIFDSAVAHWRNYEPWLGPAKAALGPALDAYPDAPARF